MMEEIKLGTATEGTQTLQEKQAHSGKVVEGIALGRKRALEEWFEDQ